MRRVDDGELCGHVAESDGAWNDLTLFGTRIRVHERRGRAEAQVLADGLASLSRRWTLRERATGNEEVVCIEEATPSEVTVIRDVMPMPGAARLTITREDLASGGWHLRPDP